MLSMSNVANPNRYYAHALVAWVFLGFVVFVVVRESIYFIGLRQALFMSTLHAQRLSSRTVLFLGIPEESLNEQGLRQAFGQHVHKIWIVPDYKKLDEAVEDREKLWNKFEAGQQKLIINANKKNSKTDSGGAQKDQATSDPLASIDKKDRPTHRLKMLIGKKVDTIEYGLTELPQMNRKVEELQQGVFSENSKKTQAAFVEFSSQAAAQDALQFAQQSKTKFSPRYIGVQPGEVIWKNLAMNKFSRKIKMAIATTAIVLLTIFWAIPVAVVGAISNINYLTEQVPFLSFINDIPSVILGVVTGLLPVILLAVLMALVPILCRLLAKFAGAPTLSAVELKTQSWYFVFQVIQVFLVTTFSSAASAVAAQIVSNPPSAVTLLAKNLPKASNFYISYFILQGLMIAALEVLNLVPFLMINILGKMDKTPRKQFNRWNSLVGLGWGSVYPKFTNLGVIALTYSCIAPLVLGFATIGFLLMYLGFRYNFLFVYGMKVDMKGESYLKGLQQLLTGVYLATGCLIGLFAIAVADATSAVGPLVLMIIFLVVLIACHVFISMALRPLKSSIPLELLAENPESTMIATDAETGPRVSDSDRTLDGPGHERHEKGSVRHAPAWQPSVSPDQQKGGNMLTHRLAGFITKSRAKARAQMGAMEYGRAPRYDSGDLQTAYMHPSLAARKPVVWLARDQMGLSRALVEGNRKAGIESSDEAAWLNDKGKVQWDTEEPRKVPIWEEHRVW